MFVHNSYESFSSILHIYGGIVKDGVHSSTNWDNKSHDRGKRLEATEAIKAINSTREKCSDGESYSIKQKRRKRGQEGERRNENDKQNIVNNGKINFYQRYQLGSS